MCRRDMEWKNLAHHVLVVGCCESKQGKGFIDDISYG